MIIEPQMLEHLASVLARDFRDWCARCDSKPDAAALSDIEAFAPDCDEKIHLRAHQILTAPTFAVGEIVQHAATESYLSISAMPTEGLYAGKLIVRSVTGFVPGKNVKVRLGGMRRALWKSDVKKLS